MKVSEIFEIASEEDFAAMKKKSGEMGKKIDAAKAKLAQAKDRMSGEGRQRRPRVRRRGTDAPSRVSAFGM